MDCWLEFQCKAWDMVVLMCIMSASWPNARPHKHLKAQFAAGATTTLQHRCVLPGTIAGLHALLTDCTVTAVATWSVCFMVWTYLERLRLHMGRSAGRG
jgi:hypothetical protein